MLDSVYPSFLVWLEICCHYDSRVLIYDRCTLYKIGRSCKWTFLQCCSPKRPNVSLFEPNSRMYKVYKMFHNLVYVRYRIAQQIAICLERKIATSALHLFFVPLICCHLIGWKSAGWIGESSGSSSSRAGVWGPVVILIKY